MIDDKLNWSENIDHVHSKLSKSLFALNCIKHLIPTSYMKTWQPHSFISHTWDITMGFDISNIHEKLEIIQKKQYVAHIAHTTYMYITHTTSLFKDRKILKLNDVHELELGKFVYDALHNTLPKRLSEIYTPNARMYYQYTSNKTTLTFNHVTVLSAKSIIHSAPAAWSNIPIQIRTRTNLNKHWRL